MHSFTALWLVLSGVALVGASLYQDRRGLFTSRLWKLTKSQEPLLFRRINRLRFLIGVVCAGLGAYLSA